MARFTQYPAATSPTDYTMATNFLIEDPNGEIKLASLEGLRTFFCGALCTSVSIPTASVLTLNSVPVEIVAAPGAGYAIEVISASLKIDFNSAAYATNTKLQLICNGADDHQLRIDALDATLSKIVKLEDDSVLAAGTTQIIENAALNVNVDTGNPTTGDSDIEVFVLYRLIAV